ncbi:SafA/ExsA family spore coat assembly protein [Bacillaceae bacterium]
MLKRIVLSLFAFFLLAAFLPANAGQAARTDTYVVKPGDSLWKISLKYGVDLSAVIRANPQIQNPALIYPGQKVNVPLEQPLHPFERQVIQLVNQERAKRGLPALQANAELSRVARIKSQDMRDRGYFSHTSPTYGSPFQMLKAFGISYRAAGENIAAGQPTPAQVVQGWMKSPGHRQNILNPNFTEIGVGYAQGGAMRHYWTQMFIRP